LPKIDSDFRRHYIGRASRRLALRGLRAPEIVVRTWQAARQSIEKISEAEVREALERFDSLWDELFPRRAGAHRPSPCRARRGVTNSTCNFAPRD
jgi:hypothetical protein